MLKQTTLILVATGLLANCSETSPVQPFGNDVVSMGTSAKTTEVNGISLAGAVPDEPRDKGLLKAWKMATTSNNMIGVFGTSSSGDSAVFSGTTNYRASNKEDPPFFSTAFKKLTETNLPTDGTVTYSGDYSGYLHSYSYYYDQFDEATLIFRGDVSITADFDESKISGKITNREPFYVNTDHPQANQVIDDVIFETTALQENGFYSGSATGGTVESIRYRGTERERVLNRGTSGAFEGTISGQNGQETVGRVEIIHRYSISDTRPDTLHYETGVFIAE